MTLPFFSYLGNATERSEKYLPQYRAHVKAYGNSGIRQEYEFNSVVNGMSENAIGLNVIGHLDNSFLVDAEYAISSVSKSKLYSIYLGERTGRVGGGKNYDALADLWATFGGKVDKVVPSIEYAKNHDFANTNLNFFGSGFHGLMMEELVWKEKYLDFQYIFNVFIPPTLNDSSKNFEELLSFHEREGSGRNIVFGNWNKSKNIAHDKMLNALVSTLVFPKAFGSRFDVDDIYGMLGVPEDRKDLPRTWNLRFAYSENEWVKRWESLPEWFLYPLNKRKPHSYRSKYVLKDLALRLEPKFDSIVIVLGDFDEEGEEIRYMREALRGKQNVEPQILVMRCGILPEIANCIVGLLDRLSVKNVLTPHFDKLKWLVGEQKKEEQKRDGGNIYG